jgi:hypothetical protein
MKAWHLGESEMPGQKRKIKAMLQYYKGPAGTTPATMISAPDLERLPMKRRAEFAVDMIEGRAALDRLSEKQVALVCGVSPAYVRKLRNSRRHHRPPASFPDTVPIARAAERPDAARAAGAGRA